MTRYIAYKAALYKDPDHFVTIYKRNLTDEMRRRFPRMFLGKDAGRIKGPFTVILVRDDVESPNEAHFLKLMKLSYVAEVEFEDFEKWAVDPDRVIDFSRLARFLGETQLAPDDPFAACEEVAPASVSSEKYDNLFVWLCATGQGSYDTFRRTADALGVPIADGAARALLRRLRLLGHLEVSDDGQRWFVTPPTVIALDDGSGHFLAGARTVSITEALEMAAFHFNGQVTFDSQETREAPRAVRIQGVSEDEISRVLSQSSAQAAAAGPAAKRLAEALPSADQAHELFSRVEHPNTHTCALAIYNSKTRDFVNIGSPSRTGFYRLTYTRSNEGPDRTLLYLADTETWYRGDWYGLRFVARHAAGERCMIGYDPRLGEVAIAKDWHLPELYERALVLASGMLPRNDKDLLVYSGITRETLDILIPKLEATLEVKSYA